MNDLISNLQIGAKIGQGYYGEVFEGNDDVHGKVAVKLIRKDYPKPETAAEWDQRKSDLLGEAQRLEKAKHPNVVEAYHLVARQDGNTVVYVMEHCGGGCLQTPYEAGPTPLPELRRVSTEVAIGLAALHARGMLHRDIKPSNILRDDTGTAKLGDFGLVTDRLILGYGSAQGYADHVAPEVWNGGPTSMKSDVWALGMTIYRLLHGATFYAEMPLPHLIVRHGGFADRLRWLPHVPKRWKRFIRHMLRDDPSDRLATAQAVQNALAGLPMPQWEIVYSAGVVRWSREQNGRRVIVEWQRGKRHLWSAWSEPLGAGRKHTLGGSGGPVNAATAQRQLERFFADRE